MYWDFLLNFEKILSKIISSHKLKIIIIKVEIVIAVANKRARYTGITVPPWKYYSN